MKQVANNKHLFALFVEQLPALHGTLNFKDADLWNRITRVLRLHTGDHLILFDSKNSLEIILDEATFASKKNIVGEIISSKITEPLFPTLYFYPCITKKTDFEEIIYTATQMGASHIVPVISEKVQRKWGGDKERKRLKKIMIAACEQSKQFALPALEQPIKLPGIALNKNDFGICFDAHGKTFSSFSQQESNKKNLHVVCGPEGGLTDKELNLLQIKGFQKFALTPTILRARDAAVVGLGILRTLLNN